MYVDWWPYLIGHEYEILSLYVGINIKSNPPWEYYTVCYESVNKYSHSYNIVYHS